MTRGFCPRGFCPEGAYVLMGFCPRGFCLVISGIKTQIVLVVGVHKSKLDFFYKY